MSIPVSIAIGAALICGAIQCSAAAELKSVEADATEFKVMMSDGKVLRSRDLIGARLVVMMDGQPMRIRIDAVERDPDTKTVDVWLHSFSYETRDGWQPYCLPGPDGRRQGFPVAGRAREDGIIEPADAGTLEITCTSGAQGKCIRFGYLPWRERDLYNACIRMVRADYCGDGSPTTRDGMTIDMYDTLAIQKPDSAPGFAFEAGWTPAGAVCVRHVRVKENTTLDKLVAACPRLKDRTGAACTEDTARSLGARLFNLSKP